MPNPLPSAEIQALAFAQAQADAIMTMTDDMLSLNDTLNMDEMFYAMSQIDPSTVMMNAGMDTGMSGYINAYQNILSETPFFAGLDETTLSAMSTISQTNVMQYVSSAGGHAIGEVMSGIIGGKSATQIRDSIMNMMGTTGNPISQKQAEIFTHTAQRTFSRQVIRVQSEQMPDGTKHVYVGVIDDRTRDICLAMAGSGGLTLQQIDEQYAGSFIDGGGFNCRHNWQPVTSSSKKLNKSKDAQRRIKERGNKFNPETFDDATKRRAFKLDWKAFKVSIKPPTPSASGVSLGFGKKFDDMFAGITDKARQVIQAIGSPNAIRQGRKGSEKAFYRHSERLIVLDNGKDTLYTMRHEFGHFIDYTLPRILGSPKRIISIDRMQRAFKLDWKALKKMHGGVDDTLMFFAKKWSMKKHGRLLGGASDIIDAMSGGQMYTNYYEYGHGVSYYRRQGYNGRLTETFANMFEAWSVDGEGWAQIQEAFPDTSNAFLEIIDELLEGIDA